MKRSKRISRSKNFSNTLPIFNNGLTNSVSSATKSSVPIIEKGVSNLYGTMARGLDLGLKGLKNIGKMPKFRSAKRSLSLAGGRRSRRNRRSRRY